ncbi:MAG: radical SAM protein [Elusimicrobia bacterium]|nr:radical SAM protein [Elusimicrobiota bacterium]
MKIAFINIALRPEAKRQHLPVGLGYVLTAVKKQGLEFGLFDMAVDNISVDGLEAMLGREDYDVYAFGCIVTGYRYVDQISRMIRRIRPDATIICGNSAATSIPELLLTNTEVDIAVLGEADITIVDLLRALERRMPISEVKGIAFKKDGKINFTGKRAIIPDLDTIGFPDWDIFNLEKYARYSDVNSNSFSGDKVVSFPLNSARGCPFQCTFCYHVFLGQKYRRYSEPAIVGEIKRLHDRYRCDFVAFWDELTFPTLKSVESRVKAIKALDFKIQWGADARAGLFRAEHLDLIRAMKESGCNHIGFALENGSPEILAAMGKKMSVDQFIEQAKVLWKGDVVPLASVIFGYPQETPETIQLTLDICEECDIYPSVGFLLPQPGTPIYEWAKKAGRIADEVEYLSRIGDRQDFHVNLTNMSDVEFVETVTRKLEALAKRQGLKLESVFKTVTFQKPATAKLQERK